MPQDQVRPPTSEFTALQLQCLEGFWNRKTAKSIAADLGLSEAWVNKNLLSVRKQLNVNSTAEAARIVYGSKPGSSKNYYYQETEVSSLALPPHPMASLADKQLFDRPAGEKALINRLSPFATVVGIAVVGVASIGGVTLLLDASQGVIQLWKVFLH